jgi:hypothetical protein
MLYRALNRLWRRVFHRGCQVPYHVAHLGDLEALARSGPAAWLLAQEKVRLDYVGARETYTRTGGSNAFGRMQERLLELQSTSAIVQALLNEHYLERLLTEEPVPPAGECSVGKSR